MKKQFYYSGSAAFLFALQLSVFGQGSLTPSDAPAPSMKTLQQIEPRTPISTLPFLISAPGSYYLTTNLTGITGTNGITIVASGVTLDLGGFALTGVSGSFDGIIVGNLSAHTNITVRNGSIQNWGRDGVDGLSGVNGRYENLTVANNGTNGIFAGSGSTVVSCLARGNGARGIQVNQPGSVIGCVAAFNGAEGLTGNGVFKDCIAHNNTGVGFSGSGEFSHCLARFNGGGFFFSSATVANNCQAVGNSFSGFNVTINIPNDSVLIGCVASGNTNAGILASSQGVVVKDCVTQNNGWSGIQVGASAVVIGCMSKDNGTNGIQTGVACLVKDCVANINDNDGINVGDGTIVSGCVAGLNTDDGIEVSLGCRVTDNLCHGNGNLAGDGAGLLATGHSNRIEGNHSDLNDRGIDVNSASNIIIRNTSRNNTGAGSPTANFDIIAGNGLATIVLTESALNTSTNSNVNLGF